MNKKRNVIIWSLISAFLLISILFLIIFAVFPGEKIKKIAEINASDALGTKVSIEKVGIALRGRPSVKFSGISIGDAQSVKPFSGSVESIYLDLKILPLFRWKLEIGNIDIIKPIFSIISLPDSAKSNSDKNLQNTTQKEQVKPVLPIPVSVNSLKLKNGKISLGNRLNPYKTVIDSISGEISLTTDAKTMKIISTGETKFGNIAFNRGNKAKKIDGINAVFRHELSGDLNNGNFELTKGLLAINGIPANINVTAENWQMKSFTVKTDEIHLPDIIKSLPASICSQKQNIVSEGNFTLDIKGNLNPDFKKFTYNGVIELSGGKLSYKGMPSKLENIDILTEFTENAIDIKNIELKTGVSNIRLSGVILDYTKSPFVKIRTNISADLADIFSILPSPSGLSAKGSFTSEISLDGNPSDPATFKTSGGINIKNTVFTIPKSFKNPLNLSGEVTVKPTNLDLTGIKVSSGKSDFSISGRIFNYMKFLKIGDRLPVIEGAINSTNLDLNNLVIIPENSPTIKPWQVESIVKTAPVPPGLTGEMKLSFGKITLGKLKMDSLSGILYLGKDNFSIGNLKISAYKGSIGGDALINFKNAGDVTYSGGFTADNLEASSFLSDYFGIGDAISGKFSSKLDFTGAGTDSLSFVKNLAGSGSMAFDKGVIKNWEPAKKLGGVLNFLSFDTLEFEKITNTFTIKDQAVYTPDMVLDSKNVKLKLDGKTGFDSSINYKILAVFDKSSSAKAINTINELSKLSLGTDDNLELKLSADGTIKSPKIKLVSSSVSKQLQETIQKKTDQLLEKQGKSIQKKGKKLLDNLLKN